MKTAIIIFLIVCHLCPYAQHTDVVPVDSMPAAGVLLDKGWKWQKGDNPEWKNPSFNDASWQAINPTLDVHHSLPQLPKSGICWFRIHLSINSRIQEKQLALILQQSIASEIYLNGILVKKFGTLDSNPENVKAYDPLLKPILLPAAMDAQQVLAVRFAFEPGVHYSTLFLATTNPALSITINGAEKAFDGFFQNTTIGNVYDGFMIGLLLLLLIIHFAYYFFYPGQKANLYFGMYALFFLSFTLFPVILDAHSVRLKFYSLNAAFVSTIITNLLLLTAIYQLLNQKKGFMYWALMGLAIPALLINFWQYNWGWHIGADFMSLLVNVNIAWVTLEAVRRKKRGAWLLAGGALLCLVLFLLFVLTLNFRPDLHMLSSLFYALGNLSIPVTTSLYLGLDFGFVSHSLQRKLAEVNDLSLKNLEQEKEKQQILAAQNETLEKLVGERTTELRKSLKDLKETQSQLIQSEKMASLGELTAGIAHEIQNPLNFVNNFSEVNKEMIAELKDEMDKGNYDEARLIAADIEANSQKINLHGRRADAIVKGMLQHSRKSTGQKEPTDINALANEYLRLSFHGLRAKDKTFNADFKTDFDESIGKINVVPQDIGRVMLNLFNNAFYAVHEHLKKFGGDYKPTVIVSTRKFDGKIEIRVQDNGMGISKSLVNKIFQPFFTTKPTGQGTGLGLSLSYDIVKAHGGEIKVESTEGEGAVFTVLLPLTMPV